MTRRATSQAGLPRGPSLDYTYDDANRLTELDSGSVALRAYAYDAAGRMTGASDPQGNTLAIGYDGRGPSDLDRRRLLGQSVGRSYDSRGNLTSQTDGRGTTKLTATTPSTGSPASPIRREKSRTSHTTPTASSPNRISLTVSSTTNSYDDDG